MLSLHLAENTLRCAQVKLRHGGHGATRRLTENRTNNFLFPCLSVSLRVSPWISVFSVS